MSQSQTQTSKLSSPPQQKPTNFAKALSQFRDTMYCNLGGPKMWPMRYTVNTFKCLTFVWVLLLMYAFNNYSKGMYVYLFLHGSYGIAWLLKDLYFPDASFKQISTLFSVFVGVGLLSAYWLMPVTIAVGLGIQQPSQTRTLLCISMYIIGLILMLGSDYQKTTTLAKKKGLISTGFFAKTRNPNYLGQILIYGSFAICTGYWLSYFIVIFVWCTLFTINMYLKDEMSYKLKQGWNQYKQKSYILLPKLFKSHLLNFVIYGMIVVICWNYYYSCCDGHQHSHGHQHGHDHSHSHSH